MLIRADFHIHASGDPLDRIRATPRDVADRARALGLSCVAIANHRRFVWDADDAAYALRRGVLLVPGIEVNIGGRDVLILNATAEAEQIRTFDDLRAYRTPERLIVAPHPFYPTPYSLREHAEETAEVYDAVEASACYLSWHDQYNRLAREFAARHNLPVVANSDAHGLWMMGTCWTEIEAEVFTVAGVVAAVKRGAVTTVMRPMTLVTLFRFVVVGSLTRSIMRSWARWRRCH